MKHHKKKSKRTKLSLKYNIQKRVKESKRRIRKEARKLGVTKKSLKKDPGIPNTWPFKAEMLQELERQKEKRDEELLKRRENAKKKAQKNQEREKEEKRLNAQAKEEERRAKRSDAIVASQGESLRRVLTTADVLLQVLDARDPLGCRSAELEAWAQQKGKRLIFVLAKADLVDPVIVAQWLQTLGNEGPTFAVQAEAGREGVADLVRFLGRPAKTPSTLAGAMPAAGAVPVAQAVGLVGYAGVGKKSLLKAMRQETPATSKWLLQYIARLTTDAAETTNATAALQLLIRGMQPKGPAWTPATATKESAAPGGPLDAVAHLLERVQAPALMRRFRLPAFSNREELLNAYAQDRKIISKKGKAAAPEAVARRLLAELPVAPGCYSAIPTPVAPAPVAGSGPHWAPHTAAAAAFLTAMKAQIAALGARPVGSHVGALSLAARGPGAAGSAVDLAAMLNKTDVPEEGTDDEAMNADGASSDEGEAFSDYGEGDDMGEGGMDEGEMGEEEMGEESEEESGSMSDDV